MPRLTLLPLLHSRREIAMKPALLLLPALIACRAPAPAPAAQTAWLAWSWTEDGPTTAWLDASGAAVYEVPALILSDGQGLWRWGESAHPLTLADCDCAQPHEGPPPPKPESCAVEGEYTQVHLYPLAGGAPVTVLGDRAPKPAPVDDPERIAFGEWSQGAAPLGSLGPYLFVQSGEGGYACGAAHGGYAAAFQAFQLGQGAIEGPLTAAERDARTQELGPRAIEELRSEMLTESDPAELTMYWPVAAGGEARMRYQLTVPVSYAGSDGSWSSYAASRTYDGPLPAALAPYAAVPAPVAARWAAQPPGEPHGWGAVSGDTGALLAQMKAL